MCSSDLAAGEVDTLDVLINNAGIAIYDDLSNSDVIGQHMAVNFFGMLNVTRAFLPLLKRSKGAIVNNLSMVALAPLPIIPAYSISKAAAFSMTQSLRAHLAGQGVTAGRLLTNQQSWNIVNHLSITRNRLIPQSSKLVREVIRADLDAAQQGDKIGRAHV